MTRGQIEDAVSKIVVRYEREHTGRGPLEARAYLLDDIVIVRLQDVFTVMEKTVLGDSCDSRKAELIRQLRSEWVSSIRDRLTSDVGGLLGVRVRGLLEDVSTQTGEAVLVFILDDKRDW